MRSTPDAGSGVRTVWWVYGVGPVRIAFEHTGGETSFAQSFWSVCGERALTVELVAQPALPARERDRRELARAAETAIRTALAGPAPATAPGTAGDRRA